MKRGYQLTAGTRKPAGTQKPRVTRPNATRRKGMTRRLYPSDTRAIEIGITPNSVDKYLINTLSYAATAVDSNGVDRRSPTHSRHHTHD